MKTKKQKEVSCYSCIYFCKQLHPCHFYKRIWWKFWIKTTEIMKLKQQRRNKMKELLKVIMELILVVSLLFLAIFFCWDETNSYKIVCVVFIFGILGGLIGSAINKA